MSFKKEGSSFTHEPERRSGIVRFVGIEDPVVQRDAYELAENIFKITENREENEVSKTPEQKQIIEFILENIPRFIERYGGEPIQGLTEDHIVLLKSDLLIRDLGILKNKSFLGGYYDIMKQRIDYFYDEAGSPLDFAHSLIHEIMHFQSFQSLQFKKSGPENVGLLRRRVGLNTYIKGDEKKQYFHDLDEAVIEELTRRFDEDVLVDCPVDSVQKDLKERSEIRKELGQEVVALRSGGEQIITVYSSERGRLKKLISDIHSDNLDKFASREEVFNVFARATMSGRLLPLARLVEKTFGKGYFRKVGKETKRIQPIG